MVVARWGGGSIACLVEVAWEGPRSGQRHACHESASTEQSNYQSEEMLDGMPDQGVVVVSIVMEAVSDASATSI